MRKASKNGPAHRWFLAGDTPQILIVTFDAVDCLHGLGHQSLVRAIARLDLNARYFGLGQKSRRVTFDRQTEVLAERPVNHRQPGDLPIKRIPGDVRRAQIDHLEQFDLDIGLPFPDIQRNSLEAFLDDGLFQSGRIHHGPARGVEQDGPFLERREELSVDQMERLIDPVTGQGRVERDEVTIVQILKRYIGRVSRLTLQRRIVPQDTHTQGETLLNDATADVADTNDADRSPLQFYTVTLADLQ